MSDALKKQKSLTTHRRDTTPWPTLARFTPLQTVMGLEERSGFHQYIILYHVIFSGISNSTGNVNFEEKNCNWDYRQLFRLKIRALEATFSLICNRIISFHDHMILSFGCKIIIKVCYILTQLNLTEILIILHHVSTNILHVLPWSQKYLLRRTQSTVHAIVMHRKK